MLAGVLLAAALATLLLALGAVEARAQSAHAARAVPQLNLSWLRDPGRDMTLAAVMEAHAQGRMQHAADGRLNFGITRDAIWLRVAIRSSSGRPEDHFVEIDYPYLDDVQFHLPAGQPGGPRSVHTGDHRPFDSREFDHRNFVLPVSLAPGEATEVFVRVRSSNAVQVPIRVHTGSGFAALEQRRLLLMGAYFGFALAMLVYNLSLGGALREPAYYWYVAFVGFFGLFHFCLNGFGFQYLFPQHPHLGTIAAYLFLAPTMAAAVQFTRSFLGTRLRTPGLDRLARGLIVALLAVIPAAFFLSENAVASVTQALAVLCILLGLGMGIGALRRGYSPARWYMLAYVSIALTGVAMVLRNLGALPWSTLTAYGTQLGAAFEAVFLGLALAGRIRRAQAEALEASRRAGEFLEREVGLRTSELAAANARLRKEIEDRERIERRLRDSEERLRRLAQRDPLTGAANRLLLAERSSATLASAQRRHARFGIVAVDLDRFKEINDAHGHAVGDRVLMTCAQRIDQCLRASDLLARTGGDEFVVLLPDLDHREALEQVVAKLRRHIEAPMTGPDDAGLALRASLGAALYPEDGRDMAALMRHADAAMYGDKDARRMRRVG